MNRTELIKAVANRTGKTQAEIKAVEAAIEEIINEQLDKGESVKLMGFGTASVKHTRARVSRNPKTGETVNVPEKDVRVFKFSAVKDA